MFISSSQNVIVLNWIDTTNLMERCQTYGLLARYSLLSPRICLPSAVLLTHMLCQAQLCMQCPGCMLHVAFAGTGAQAAPPVALAGAGSQARTTKHGPHSVCWIRHVGMIWSTGPDVFETPDLMGPEFHSRSLGILEYTTK